ncbi:MAG: DUF4062 domain-containing protein [bacterium]|nr:DUF4062 domain-containing protein [bacterium]
MDEARNRVFISGSRVEFDAFIKAAVVAITNVGMEAVRLEDEVKKMVGTGQKPMAFNEHVVRSTDIFVGLFGFNSSWPPPDSEKTILELEYEWAKDAKLTCIFYLSQQEKDAGPFAGTFRQLGRRQKLLHEAAERQYRENYRE